MLDKVVRKVAELPPGSWIVGQGTYGQPMPTREELDEVAPDHPVVLRWSMHLQVANSKALELSGLDRRTPPIRRAGGSSGTRTATPTGIFVEAFDLLAIPSLP